MKKKTLKEELERIHSLTYGKLNENFIQDIVMIWKSGKIFQRMFLIVMKP